MFTVIAGPKSSAGVLSEPINSEGAVQSYLNSQSSLEPIIEFIDGAVALESIQCLEKFGIDTRTGSVSIEVLNFTDMDVEAQAVDPKLFRESAERAAAEFWRSIVDNLKADINELPEEDQGEFEAELRELEKDSELIQQHLLEEMLSKASGFIELLVNGGQSRVLLSEGQEVRAVVLSCPEELCSPTAQDHYYVIIQDLEPGFESDIYLFASEKMQRREDFTPDQLEKIVETALGRMEVDETAFQDEDDSPTMAIMREIIPCLRFHVLVEADTADLCFSDHLAHFGQVFDG
jgi:hypothetical protein